MDRHGTVQRIGAQLILAWVAMAILLLVLMWLQGLLTLTGR